MTTYDMAEVGGGIIGQGDIMGDHCITWRGAKRVISITQLIKK